MAENIGFFSSLQFKIVLLITIFSAILMGSAILYLERDIRESMIAESVEKGLGIARGAAFNAEDPLLTGDDLYLFSAVNIARKSQGVSYAHIVGDKGIIKASSRMALTGTPYSRPVGESLRVEGTQNHKIVRIDFEGHSVLDLSVPIVAVADPTLVLGEIHIGISEDVISAAVAKMQRNLLLLTVVVLILGVVVALFLSRFLIRPIDALVAGVTAIGEGKLEKRIELKRKDEFGVLTRAFNEMAASLWEKEFIKNTFERYVSKELAHEILQHKEELQLGGEEKEVTILFSDLRGFTSLSEKLSPAEVVSLLNIYFTRMIEVISAHQGMVDKFIGDAIMALFGAPIRRGDDPLKAVQCGLEMQRQMHLLNEDRISMGLPPLIMGIGINTGSVVAGNIGSIHRMEYTVIGDTVNVASRLEGASRCGDVLITEATYLKIKDAVHVTRLEPMVFKGKSSQINVYRVDGLITP